MYAKQARIFVSFICLKDVKKGSCNSSLDLMKVSQLSQAVVRFWSIAPVTAFLQASSAAKLRGMILFLVTRLPFKKTEEAGMGRKILVIVLVDHRRY